MKQILGRRRKTRKETSSAVPVVKLDMLAQTRTVLSNLLLLPPPHHLLNLFPHLLQHLFWSNLLHTFLRLQKLCSSFHQHLLSNLLQFLNLRRPSCLVSTSFETLCIELSSRSGLLNHLHLVFKALQLLVIQSLSLEVLCCILLHGPLPHVSPSLVSSILEKVGPCDDDVRLSEKVRYRLHDFPTQRLWTGQFRYETTPLTSQVK